MNTRLKIICILFAIAYVLTMANQVVRQMSFDSSQFTAAWDSNHIGESLKHLSIWGQLLFFAATNFIFIISCFSIFIFAFYVPSQVYKIIKSIINDKVFDLQNIKRIRNIGYSILLLSILIVLIVYPYVKYLFSLGEIKSKWLGLDLFSLDRAFYLLLFGLLTLLFAEIMKISHTIKEENDLMI